MSMTITGESLKKYIQQSSEEKGKIFLHDEHDDALASNIATYFNNLGVTKDFIEDCVSMYFETSEIGVSLKEFVTKMNKIVETTKDARQERRKFQEALNRTKKLMEEG